MSCALPCTWWCCMIEPVWAPPRKLRTKSLSYVCSGLFRKPILCFVLSCEIRVASMSSVDSMLFPKWCSHIPMWILILHDNRDFHVNPFQPVWFSSRWSYHFSYLQDPISVLPNGVCFHPSQVSFVFPTHPPLFLQGLGFLYQVSILWMWILFTPLFECSYPVILM